MIEEKITIYEVREHPITGELSMLTCDRPKWEVEGLPEWFSLTPAQAIVKYQAGQMSIIKAAREKFNRASRLMV